MITKLRTMTATAMLLSFAYAPQALADTVYNFSATLNAGLSGGTLSAADRLFTARLVTNASPTQTSGIVNIIGITGTLGTGTNAERLLNIISPAAPGPFGTINLGLGAPGIGRLTSFVFDFSRGAAYSDMPWSMTSAFYSGNPAVLKVTTSDALADGGNNVGAATLVRVPEIDGGLLPRAMFVLSGIFLIAFGRKQVNC